MCGSKPKMPKMPEQPRVVAPDNQEANGRAAVEARLRRRRAGAAADILTGPSGIPATPTLGGVAR